MHDNAVTKELLSGVLHSSGDAITILAPAKINLFLKVLRKRPDGYHDIFSWFQAIDLCDKIDIARSPDSGIELTVNHPSVPTGRENLVYKAANTMQSRFGLGSGFRVQIDKRIPVGAGMGGGSSDAAATIKGINTLCGLGLDRAVMAKIGLSIGSDVPFFFGRGQAEVTGRGEAVADIEFPQGYTVLLVTPPFEIRAVEAYGKCKIDLTGGGKRFTLPNCRHVRELFDVISALANDLEWALLDSYPVLVKIRDELTKTGAEVVRLSGSGPTMFALYEDKAPLSGAMTPRFEGNQWGVRTARPLILPV